MKRLFAPLVAISISLPVSVFAGVDPKIHKLCIEAKDYAGCVKAMTSDTSTETTVRQIQQQGANLTEGNSCPAQHIYSGGGYCQRVVCISRGLFGKGHGQGLGGKGISCKGGAELTWDNTHQPIRASYDKNCPKGEPEVGYASTCYEAADKGYFNRISYGYTRENNGYIKDVIAGSPAELAGIKAGDTIVSIDGTPIKNVKRIELYEGQKHRFAIKRGSQRFEVTLEATMLRIPIETLKQ